MDPAAPPSDRLLRVAIVGSVVIFHLAALAVSANFLTLKQPPLPPRVTYIDLQEPATPKPLPPPPKPPVRTQVQLPVVTDKPPIVPDAQAMPAQEGPASPPPVAQTPVEPDYLPQFKIDQVPVMPEKVILSRTVYPPLAAKQGIEAVVFLELYIDETGRIRKISVLKDPGFGLADAAVKALDGVVTQPAQAQGKPVAVKFRYAVRFKLK